MQQTIIAATNGWYVVRPRFVGTRPTSIDQMPIVAWRIGTEDPQPIVLYGNESLRAPHLAIMDPGGGIRTSGRYFEDARAYLDSVKTSMASPMKSRRAASSEVEDIAETERAAPSRYLSDIELAEEDQTHAPVQLVSETGRQLTMHAHEWKKALELARNQGWSGSGTHNDASGSWDGSYDASHNQVIDATDASALAAAIEQAIGTLPARKADSEIAATSDAAVTTMSASDYFGGIKGSSFLGELVRMLGSGPIRIS